MNQPRMFAAACARDERVTPDDLFAELDAEHHFTIDVAADAGNAKCARFYTVEDDGLQKSWKGEVVWCNPPFSEVDKWIAKAKAEGDAGAKVVMLLPANTDTRWFHNIVLPFGDIRYMKGRIRFKHQPHAAPFPTMIVTFPKQQPAKRMLFGMAVEIDERMPPGEIQLRQDGKVVARLRNFTLKEEL